MVEVEHKDGLQGIYKLLDCSMIEVATYLDSDCVYVDEEGLYSGKNYGFEISGGHQPFIGNALIVGTTKTGKDKSTKFKVWQIQEKVRFLAFQAR